MNTFVYLIKKGDLYKIGSGKNIIEYFKKIKPDEILATIETDYAKALEARLLRRYMNSRMPESNYFNLTEKQIEDCISILSNKGNRIISLNDELVIAMTSSILLFLGILFLHLFFALFHEYYLSWALFFASLPMWLLFLVGNLGGYYSNDLPLFLLWPNRLRSFFLALLITSLSVFSFNLQMK